MHWYSSDVSPDLYKPQIMPQRPVLWAMGRVLHPCPRDGGRVTIQNVCCSWRVSTRNVFRLICFTIESELYRLGTGNPALASSAFCQWAIPGEGSEILTAVTLPYPYREKRVGFLKGSSKYGRPTWKSDAIDTSKSPGPRLISTVLVPCFSLSYPQSF
jgi:hypothetical protein